MVIPTSAPMALKSSPRGSRKSRLKKRIHCLSWFAALSFITVTITINISFLNGNGSQGFASSDFTLPALNSHDTVEPLANLLRFARVNLTTEELEAFPKWKEVVAKFGDRPRILGSETCEAYRDAIPKERRHVAPAGSFNSGTNLLYQLLAKNCVVNSNENSFSQTGIDWQVNWGKKRISTKLCLLSS